jgi:DNA-binding CsgD family transcriptional regulator
MRGALSRAPARARLLPPDITDFTGRPAELAVLTDPSAFPPHAAALFTVTGAGGTGKTALAVRAARLVGEAFPDAHLYADLGGYADDAPVPAPDILRRFLRALGAEGPLPPDPDELVGMFRTALAGRRTLVVLDDADDEAQVRPLLPAGPDALAIVTSRNWLGGLAGAVPLRLGPMPEAEAAAMLARMLGPRWTGQEDTGDLLALCGHLPLAIRIAAARLLSRPQMSVQDLCDQLRDEGRRLKRLTAGDITVNGVLSSSYEALEPGDQKVFRRLALLPGFDFCTEAAALTAGLVREEAQEALDRLADRSVVRAESRPGRYSLHSLSRLYAAGRLADEDTDAVRVAEGRHLQWVLARLHAAAEVINPCLVRLPREETAEIRAAFDRESALAWLDAERHNLLALVRHHRRSGDPAVCWTVPDALRGYFHARRHLREWTRMAGIGMAAARHAGDLRGQAAMHLSLGLAELAADRGDEAEDHFHRTIEFSLASGWHEGEAAAYRNLAEVALVQGDDAASEKYLSLWADLKEALGRCPMPDRAGPDGEAVQAVECAASRDWASLSHREQTVARLVVQGLTNQQIAKRIRCSPETVKFHLRNIFRKLDIGSRVEIARFVLAPGRPA